MEMEKKKSIYRWMRVAHRDIGFFVIGLTIIYCISGILLTFRDTDFLKSETQMEKTLEPGLAANQLGRALHLRNLNLQRETDTEIRFAGGVYNKETGQASYVSKELPLIVQKLNGLHVTSSRDARHYLTVLYACCLLFLGISSFWMYKPGHASFRRGIVLATLGGALSILLILA